MPNLNYLVIVSTALLFSPFGSVTANIRAHSRCQTVRNDLCKIKDYNSTILPNLFGHKTQEEAALPLLMFTPLIKKRCHPNIQLFACSIYLPVCTVLESAIPPCSALCESVQDACEGVFEEMGYSWPTTLNCSQFPQQGLCINTSA